MKGRVAAKKLVAPEARKRNLQARLARCPGGEVSVDAVHARLVERANSLVESHQHLVARQLQFAVLSAQAIGRMARLFAFGEFNVRERDGKRVDARAVAAGQRGKSRRIQSAAQKNAYRNISKEM